MELGETLLAAVAQQLRGRMHAQAAAFVEPEVVLAPLGAGGRQDRGRGLVHGHLAFERVTLLFTRVAGAPLFLGRSTGCSVASTTTTLQVWSVPPALLRPGRAKLPLWMSAFSTRLMVRQTVFSPTRHSRAKW
jgi:hypothetical protein